MAVKFQLRRDTAASWSLNNPTLSEGEPGVETDTLKFKLGDGTTAWNSLDYAGGAYSFSELTNKPTTVAGYGIVDNVSALTNDAGYITSSVSSILNITNNTASTTTTTGALTVTGGVGVAGTVTAGAFSGNVTGTVSSLSNHTTTNLTEGTNQYFTQARARGSVSVTDTGGDGSLAYDNSTGVFTYTGPSATEVRAHFSNGTGVTITNGSIAIGQSVATTDNVTFNDLTVSGTLTVNGSTTTINSTTLTVDDINIVVASGASSAAEANGAGLTVDGANATITYTSADNRWNLNKDLNVANVYGDLTGTLTGNVITSSVDSADSSAITIIPDVIMQAGLTVGNHILPSSNENIDLGSASFRFRDLYLSGSTIKLGNATISAIGSDISLPGGTTIGGLTVDTIVSTATSSITATSLGLGNVTNESKATMFANPTFTGTVSGVTATHVGLGNVTNESKSTMFTNPTFTGTVSGVTATHVGLGNVTNESKATMFANPTFTGTVSGVTAEHVGLGNVTNESKATMFTNPIFTGTVTGVTPTHLGLGNVTNESKATMFTSPTFTGTATFASTIEVLDTKTSATGTVTHDFSTSSVWVHTGISGNFTANFTNVPALINKSLTVSLILVQSGTGRMVTAVQVNGSAQSITWIGGSTPSGAANATDVVNFTFLYDANGALIRCLGAVTTYG
jgi:acetyltransferase-like isoleucine patch superfamily enzyme